MAEHDKVPRYFSDYLQEFGRFREENAKEHGQLESRLTWRLVSAVTASTAIAIAALTFVIVYLA